MAELINIILRLALYVDLLLLFGVGLFTLYSANADLRSGPMLRGLALIGALLSVAGLVLMTSTMSGETELAALWPHLQMMLLETDVGLAWALRMIALIVVLIQPGSGSRRRPARLSSALLRGVGTGPWTRARCGSGISSATSCICWRRVRGWVDAGAGVAGAGSCG
jgi:putative copper export protein